MADDWVKVEVSGWNVLDGDVWLAAEDKTRLSVGKDTDKFALKLESEGVLKIGVVDGAHRFEDLPLKFLLLCGFLQGSHAGCFVDLPGFNEKPA